MKQEICSVTYQSTSIGLGPLVQQHLGHAVVTTMCRYVQRRQMVQSDVVNLSIVLQKLADAVHVITLCCHVDGRQAVLHDDSTDDRSVEQKYSDTISFSNVEEA